MKKSILVAGVLMAASLVQAEVISWRVYLGENDNGFFDSAQLFATVSDNAHYKTAATLPNPPDKVNTYFDYGVLENNATVSYQAGVSFFVKLYSGDNVVGYSDLMSWSTLVNQGSLVSGIAPSLPATTVWNAVPEPTSMALLAMGVSALLLRRKRVA